jgi:hypothetical protein
MNGEKARRVDSKVAFQRMNRRVCKSVDDLGKTLKEMVALVPEMVDEILRDVLEQIYLELISTGVPPTPIDTGRARMGWKVDTKLSDWMPPDMKNNRMSEAAILAAAEHALDSLPKSSVYCLYNNLPYIGRLERGWSDQAPKGFFAQAVRHTRRLLEQQLKRVYQ